LVYLENQAVQYLAGIMMCRRTGKGAFKGVITIIVITPLKVFLYSIYFKKWKVVKNGSGC